MAAGHRVPPEPRLAAHRETPAARPPARRARADPPTLMLKRHFLQAAMPPWRSNSEGMNSLQ